jgi:predicted metal-dependent peptidase
LLHPIRRGERIPELWNIAADIVVNGIIEGTSFSVPPATAVEPRYADLSVEQVYVKLLNGAAQLAGTGNDGDDNDDESADINDSSDCSGANGNSAPDESADSDSCKGGSGTSDENDAPTNAPNGSGSPQPGVDAMQRIYPATADLAADQAQGDSQASDDSSQQTVDSRTRQKRLEGYWKEAMTRAETAEQLAGGKYAGDRPLGLQREIDQVRNPQIDWRTLLWRFMARTPCDFSGYDRRFVHRGLYLDELIGDSLVVRIAMDTSGSIEAHELAQFRAEVESILRCYNHIDAKLYLVDCEVYGPYPITANERITSVEGGGGTDFSVFFERLEADYDPFTPSICVYLTDGYGDFPEKPPEIPVLWVVTKEGYEDYPFGEVARLAY